MKGQRIYGKRKYPRLGPEPDEPGLVHDRAFRLARWGLPPAQEGGFRHAEGEAFRHAGGEAFRHAAVEGFCH